MRSTTVFDTKMENRIKKIFFFILHILKSLVLSLSELTNRLETSNCVFRRFGIGVSSEIARKLREALNHFNFTPTFCVSGEFKVSNVEEDSRNDKGGVVS